MSFILDALKKIEADRRSPLDPGGASARISRERSIKRRAIVAMGAVAVASAAVTAGLLVGLGDRGSATVEEAQELSLLPAPEVEVAEAAMDETAVVLSRPEAQVGVEPAAVEEPPPDPEPAVGVAPEETALEAPTPEVTPPPDEGATSVRLVGQESALADEEPFFEEEESESADEEEPTDEEAGADFPQLTLQGTSVLNGEPVAVISDQRVFEGDRIQGAVVIRIEERAVELEFEGRRFRIEL